MPSDDGPSARYSDGSGTRVQPLAEPGRLVPIAHTTRTEVQVVGRVDGPITALTRRLIMFTGERPPKGRSSALIGDIAYGSAHQSCWRTGYILSSP